MVLYSLLNKISITACLKIHTSTSLFCVAHFLPHFVSHCLSHQCEHTHKQTHRFSLCFCFCSLPHAFFPTALLFVYQKQQQAHVHTCRNLLGVAFVQSLKPEVGSVPPFCHHSDSSFGVIGRKLNRISYLKMFNLYLSEYLSVCRTREDRREEERRTEESRGVVIGKENLIYY